LCKKTRDRMALPKTTPVQGGGLNATAVGVWRRGGAAYVVRGSKGGMVKTGKKIKEERKRTGWGVRNKTGDVYGKAVRGTRAEPLRKEEDRGAAGRRTTCRRPSHGGRPGRNSRKKDSRGVGGARKGTVKETSIS